MFIRVRATDLIEKYRAVEGRSKFNLDNDEVDDLPDHLEYLYVKRLTVKGGAKGRSYTYLYVTTKPKDVMSNEVEQIVNELKGWGLEYDATLATSLMIGERTYSDGTGVAEILSHLPERGMSTAINAIMENPSPYLLVIKAYKNNLSTQDRKLVVRSSNHHCFLMGEEDDIIRLKLKYGGKLIDMTTLR